MTARQEQQMTARQRMKEEEDREQQEEREYEDFLQHETERMKVRGFAPKVWLFMTLVIMCHLQLASGIWWCIESS